MDARGVNESKTPWGAPASKQTSTGAQTQNNATQQTPFCGSQSLCHERPSFTPNHQRPGPYIRDQHRGRGANMANSFQNGRRQNDSPGYQSPRQSFSPQNPFVSPGHGFSNDNPFQNKAQNFSPNNPFQRDNQNNSPRFQQDNYKSSPVSGTPGMNSSFSPRTPKTPFYTPSSQTPFYTPSPKHNSHYKGNSDSSSQQSFHRRNSGMCNPGGSSNIQDYISPGMLEDPWRNLPPKPNLQSD